MRKWLIHVRLLASNLDYKNHLCTLHITSGNLHELKASRVSLRKQRLPCALRHDKQSRRFSNSRGLSASVSFLSSSPPPRLLGPFFARSLLRGLWLSKQHGNACYAGYKELHTFVIAGQSDWSRKISLAMTRQITQEDTNQNNCCQVFSRSRNDQPLFVNECKVNVGWQSSSLENTFSGFRRAKHKHL